MTKAELEAAAREWVASELLGSKHLRDVAARAYKAGALFGAEQAATLADELWSATGRNPSEEFALKRAATAIRQLFKGCERGGG